MQNEKVEAIRIPLNQDTSPDHECFDQVFPPKKYAKMKKNLFFSFIKKYLNFLFMSNGSARVKF